VTTLGFSLLEKTIGTEHGEMPNYGNPKNNKYRFKNPRNGSPAFEPQTPWTLAKPTSIQAT